MVIFFDNGGHHPREGVEKEYSRFAVGQKTIVGLIFSTTTNDVIAERRPDGKWYLRRDWDAPGYTDFSISVGNGVKGAP